MAIVDAHLSDKPMRFATATRAAEADGGRAGFKVAKARGGTGGELFWLQNNTSIDEPLHLIGRAAGVAAELDVLVGGHSVSKTVQCSTRLW